MRPSRSWQQMERDRSAPLLTRIRWITAAWERISAPSHAAAVRRLELYSVRLLVRVSFSALPLRCAAQLRLCRAAALSTAAVIA